LTPDSQGGGRQFQALVPLGAYAVHPHGLGKVPATLSPGLRGDMGSWKTICGCRRKRRRLRGERPASSAPPL